MALTYKYGENFKKWWNWAEPHIFQHHEKHDRQITKNDRCVISGRFCVVAHVRKIIITFLTVCHRRRLSTTAL